MAAATARGTSDACTVAWPSPLRAAAPPIADLAAARVRRRTILNGLIGE